MNTKPSYPVYLALLSFGLPLALPQTGLGATISIEGGTDGSGGEFLDYETSLAPGGGNQEFPWDPSTQSDSAVTLSAGLGNNGQMGFNLTSNYVATREINFSARNDTLISAAEAIAGDHYLSFSLDGGGNQISLDSITLDMWRNGGAAFTDYQLAYDDGGDGFTTADLLGDAPVTSNAGGVPG